MEEIESETAVCNAGPWYHANINYWMCSMSSNIYWVEMILMSAFATACLVIHVVMLRRLSKIAVGVGYGTMIIGHGIF
jgi:hypothetical protein